MSDFLPFCIHCGVRAPSSSARFCLSCGVGLTPFTDRVGSGSPLNGTGQLGCVEQEQTKLGQTGSKQMNVGQTGLVQVQGGGQQGMEAVGKRVDVHSLGSVVGGNGHVSAVAVPGVKTTQINDKESFVNKWDDAHEKVIDGIKKMYEAKLKPIEANYRFDQFHSPLLTDVDFEAKPMVE